MTSDAAAPRRGQAWTSRAFLLFFAGTATSATGSAVTTVATPILALTVLHASSTALGLLRSAGLVPFLILAVPVGVLADRCPRRLIMIIADLARMLLLATVAVLAITHHLSVAGLTLLVVASGCFTVANEVCYLATPPELVDHDQFPAANSALEVTQAGANIAGPALGGALVQALGAGGAVITDAASYAISAALLLVNRWQVPTPTTPPPGMSGHALLEGFTFLRRDPYVGPLTAYLGVNNCFVQMFQTALLVAIVGQFHLGAAVVGTALAAMGVGFLLGAATSPALGRRFGIGRVLITASGLGACGIGVTALPHGGVVAPVAGAAVVGLGTGLYNLHSISIRQAVTPHNLLGRVGAAVKAISYTSMALGAFLGGWLSTHLTAPTTLLVAAAGSLLATAMLSGRTLRTMTSMPAPQPRT